MWAPACKGPMHPYFCLWQALCYLSPANGSLLGISTWTQMNLGSPPLSPPPKGCSASLLFPLPAHQEEVGSLISVSHHSSWEPMSPLSQPLLARGHRTLLWNCTWQHRLSLTTYGYPCMPLSFPTSLDPVQGTGTSGFTLQLNRSIPTQSGQSSPSGTITVGKYPGIMRCSPGPLNCMLLTRMWSSSQPTI